LILFSGVIDRHLRVLVQSLPCGLLYRGIGHGSRILKAQLNGRRLRLSDDQRRCLVAKGIVLAASCWRKWRPS
jgi:hypothetical protein